MKNNNSVLEQELKKKEDFFKETVLQALRDGTLDVEGLPQELRDRVLSILVEENIKQARTDFHTYVKIMAEELIPTGFKDGRHIQLICKELMEVEQSIIETLQGKRPFAKRMQFFLPPGAMKSLLISTLFSTWFLGRNPKLRVIQVGYNQDFAEDNFGQKVRDIIGGSAKFQAIFPALKIKKDTRAKGRFSFTLGGEYKALGATTPAAGKRAHLLLCDDVISEHTAFSDLKRTEVVKNYIPGLRSRLLDASAEIIVNTRWHIDDLSAFLLKIDQKGKNPWKVISIPALLDAEACTLLGFPKSKVGHSYWPENYSDDYLFMQRDSYIAAGEPAKWSALFMQNPIPEEGNIVKKDYIKYWKEDEPPTCDLVIVSVDTAFETTKRADFSAITVWGSFRTRFRGHNGVSLERSNVILLDAVRGKWELPELIKELKRVNEEFKPDWVIIEKKASGISVIQELRRCPEIPLFEYIPDKDKMSRLQAALPTMKAGCVWFPENMTFTEPVVTELLQFPAGKNDDFVDTVSMLINWMRMNSVLLQPGERGYLDEDEEDDTDILSRDNNGYWSQIARRR